MDLLEVDFNLWATQLFTGIVLGLTLILLAVGLSLIFGLMGVVNFAHGAFYALGAYLGFVVIDGTGNYWLALAVAPIGLVLAGFITERGFVRPLTGRSPYEPLLLTFGLTFVIAESLKLIFGPIGKPFEIPELFRGVVDFGFFVFPKFQIFRGGVALLVVAVVWLLLERTDMGRVVRAGTQDRVMVEALGINLTAIRAVVFALGIGLAGLAGVLSAPMVGVHPDMGLEILLFSFIVVVVGGLGSFWGPVLAGLLVGLVISFTTLYQPEWSQISVFVLMAVILLLRPRGLVGTV
ncbi:MAG: branched-chain amino acid ABC transporter permease [Dehalococcoidia bacterium]|nr:branched-chain amino acid ABC transporter permease [Dehalococcoidia bacterium]